MNKQVRFTTALALGAAVLSIPTLGYAQLTVEIGDGYGNAKICCLMSQ